KQRAEAEGLERADPEGIRIQAARDQVHHRAERVDHEEILGEERRGEEDEGEAERSLRPRVHAAVHEEQDGRQDGIRRADREAADHQDAGHPPTRFTRRAWTYLTISPGSPSWRVHLLPDRLEDRVVPF